jgi:hypothetical protein
MRLKCLTLSRSSTARSRAMRRRSSCSGEGGTTIEQTCGSARCHAINASSSVSPSIALVFASRCHRGDRRGIDHGALDAIRLEHSMHPEAIQAGLPDDDNSDQSARDHLRLCPQARQQTEMQLTTALRYRSPVVSP